MGARLTDSELAQRVRAANQRRAARLVERQKAAGRVAMTIWVDSTMKARIEAARHGAALNETAERLLLAGLKQDPVSAYHCYGCDARMTVEREKEPLCEACEAASQLATTPASNTTKPVYTGVVSSRDALMVETGKLLADGLSGAEVARRLNASGQRTANGSQFTSANLLRDYRAWLKKTGNEG